MNTYRILTLSAMMILSACGYGVRTPIALCGPEHCEVDDDCATPIGACERYVCTVEDACGFSDGWTHGPRGCVVIQLREGDACTPDDNDCDGHCYDTPDAMVCRGDTLSCSIDH